MELLEIELFDFLLCVSTKGVNKSFIYYIYV